MSKRKGEPFASPSRSMPYTRRRTGRVTSNWNGIYNLIGLVFPAVNQDQETHVALTNRVCETHAL